MRTSITLCAVALLASAACAGGAGYEHENQASEEQLSSASGEEDNIKTPDGAQPDTVPADGVEVAEAPAVDAEELDDNALGLASLEPLEPVIHLHFGPEVSREEGDARFQEALAEHRASAPVEKTSSSNFTFKLVTGTGFDASDGTDGAVNATVWFRSSLTSVTKVDVKLDNPGDDREPGSLDYYQFTVYYVNKAVSWMSVKKAKVELKGTDGWLLRSLFVDMQPEYQLLPHLSSGYTKLNNSPDDWLDSNNSNQWDHYTSNTLETEIAGKIHF